MNKKILAILIANAVLATNASANSTSLTDQLRSIETEEAKDTGLSFSGHIGSSLEYEHKDTINYEAWGGAKSKERTLTNALGHIYLHQHDIDLIVDYAMKQVDHKKRDEGGYYENKDSLKHLLLVNRPISLGNGWGTGLSYEAEHEISKVTSGDRNTGDNYLSNEKMTATEQFFRPYLTYWNNDYNAGFYSYADYLKIDQKQGPWGDREEKGHSILFKPYMVHNNFRYELEFFYQSKDTDKFTSSGSENGTEDFVEKYIEPTVRYSFDNAGVAFLTVRYTEKETALNDGTKYFTDSLKTTVGYETNLGNDWMVKAEYEYTKEKETSNLALLDGQEKEVDNHKVYVHAMYRF